MKNKNSSQNLDYFSENQKSLGREDSSLELKEKLLEKRDAAQKDIHTSRNLQLNEGSSVKKFPQSNQDLSESKDSSQEFSKESPVSEKVLKNSKLY